MTIDTVGKEPNAPFGHSHGPYLTGAYAPVTRELVETDLPVEGEIPKDLNGVYLRNGPNPHFEPIGSYHPFDGDGMLHAVEFRNGKMTYRNKWLRTEGFLENDAKGEETYLGITQTVKGSDKHPMSDVSNTDVIGHGGKALTTWYLAGKPYLVDPISLETLATADYVRPPGNGMSAHPKVDEVTGDLLFFDYFSEPPYMSYGVVNASGELTHHVPIELPDDRLMHDMGVTEHYSILHDVPVFHDKEALAAGRHKIRFDASLPIRFGVIPRHGASDSIQWFEFSSCFLYHVINCWEDGDNIVMIACRYMPSLNSDGSIDEERTAKNIANLVMDARLWRYTMNRSTGEGHEQCLNPEYNAEFPGYNSALTGRYTRWAYCVDHDAKILRWTGIRKFNTDTGESVGAWSDDYDHCWYSEPWFAPADNPTAEDHGYVVVFAGNDKTGIQQLQVFDATDISKGPVARVEIPHYMPQGFHACWMKPSQIENWNQADNSAPGGASQA